MEKFLETLGYKYRDKVTGYDGVAESVSVDLYGCVQIALRPPSVEKDGKRDINEGRWFDHSRLERLDSPRVMEPVTPSEPRPTGPADKSTMRQG